MKFCRTCGHEYDAGLDVCPRDGHSLRELPHSGGPRLAIGAVVDGRYRIDGLLGAGGMGWVYRATQRSVERTVALKILPPAFASDELAISRFMREAKAASLLSNPHATTLFEFGQSGDGTLYLAMEFVDGPTLSEYLRRVKQLDPTDACDIAIHLCNALEEAHQKGVLHRDLKPSNVMLVEKPGHRLFAKVLDFGLAKIVHADTPSEEHATKSGAVFGTPRYMSPEQAMGKPLDARSDLYSLAVMLYEMLAGVAPFEEESPMALLLHHIQSAPPSVNARRKVAPPALESIVARGLAKSPSARFQTASELREALRQFLRGQALEQRSARDGETLSEAHLSPRPLSLRGASGDETATDMYEADPTRESSGDALVPTASAAPPPSGEAPDGRPDDLGSFPSLDAGQPGVARRSGAAPSAGGTAGGTATRTIVLVVLATALSVIALGSVALYSLRWIWLGRTDSSPGTAQADRSRPLSIDVVEGEDGRGLDALTQLVALRDALGAPPRSGATTRDATPTSERNGDTRAPAPTPLADMSSPMPRQRADTTAPRRKRPSGQVVVRVVSTPTADLWLRGRRIGTTPSRITLAKGSRVVVLRLKRRGFKTSTLSVVPDRDRLLRVSLRAVERRTSGGDDRIFRPLPK